MLYDIRVRIAYQYETLAAAGRHILRLTPAALPREQAVLASSLDIHPEPRERSGFIDFFGNQAIEAAISTPHMRFEALLHARVERLILPPPQDASPSLAELRADIANYAAFDLWAPHHYLADSPLVAVQDVMTDYARAQLAPDMSIFQAANAIARALHRDMQFDPDATTVETPPLEAFTRRRGVCQDFTHIMIACLRGLGVPAAYVSGFLRTIPAPGQARLDGADAMHAWTRVWCGSSMGWIEFDPTNAILVAADHVVAARGRDYSDVAPIKGVLRAGGSQDSLQSVDVVALDQ
ncbi:MAG: transglutaminase family protein [Caulobacterales bacterium]